MNIKAKPSVITGLALGFATFKEGAIHMRFLFDLLFNQPQMPPIDLPIPARLIPKIHTTIQAALRLTYERGVYDGFVAGVLVSILFIPSLRGRAIKGAANVAENL